MSPNLVLGSAAVVAAAGALWWGLSGPRRPRSTVDLGPGVDDLRAMALQRGAGERAVQPLLARMGGWVGRHTPQGRVAALERRLLLAGTPAGWTVDRVLATKVLLGAAGTGLGALLFVADPGTLRLASALALAGGGYFGPEVALGRRARQRQEEIKRALADAIDQITVGVQAGLGLDAALARVAGRIGGPLGAEMSRVVQDLRAGMGRGEALAAMADRAQVPELRHVVLALAQAEKLGVPVARTLQVQAGELRVKRRQHAEEQAMKLPVKILFPTVLCILPTLFIVVLGPGAIQIYESLMKG